MDAEDIRLMFEYYFEMNRRMWQGCIMHMTDAQFLQDMQYSRGSIRDQVCHLISAETRYIARIQGIEPLPEYPPEESHMTRAQVRATWDNAEAATREYLKSLTNDDLQREITFDIPYRGGVKHNKVWQILIHITDHATDHRAQILAMAHLLGVPTVEQGFILWLSERQQSSES